MIHDEPTNWVTEIGDEGEPYSYPPALNSPGFFEVFFNKQKEQLLCSGELSINALRLPVNILIIAT